VTKYIKTANFGQIDLNLLEEWSAFNKKKLYIFDFWL
jgi:hypothetical protein